MIIISVPFTPLPFESTMIISILDDWVESFSSLSNSSISTSGIKPTQENIKRLETQALRSLVNEKIQLQEAIKLDVPSSDDEVNLMLERIDNGNQISGQEILQQINSQGVRAETLLNQIKAELLWNKIVRGRYGSYINVNEDEVSIVKSTTSEEEKELNTIISRTDLILYQELVRRVPIADNVVNFAVELVSKTRPNSDKSSSTIKDWIDWGAGPRASQYLVLGAKAKAILDGRPAPEIDDIKAMAKPVLRHRLITNFNAEAEGLSTDDILIKLLEDG